jgi:3-isopropylmalate dehydratase
MPAPVGTPQTLYDKVFSAHIVDEKLDGTILLYIGMSLSLCFIVSMSSMADKSWSKDRHLVHEVTSPVSLSPLQKIGIGF